MFIFPCILHCEPRRTRTMFSWQVSDLAQMAKWSKMARISWIQGAPSMWSNLYQIDSRYYPPGVTIKWRLKAYIVGPAHTQHFTANTELYGNILKTQCLLKSEDKVLHASKCFCLWQDVLWFACIVICKNITCYKYWRIFLWQYQTVLFGSHLHDNLGGSIKRRKLVMLWCLMQIRGV